jgi:N6-L-threonylcarbamoyladenine synthase
MKSMIILSIETSCDETAISIVEFTKEGVSTKIQLLGNTLISQSKIHAEYGGVFPMLAKREHQKNLVPILRETLMQAKLMEQVKNTEKISQEVEKILEKESELLEQFKLFIPGIKKPPIDAIAVTQGPGLEPALWVGINFARALAVTWDLPLIPTNHMEGHILVSTLEQVGQTEYVQKPIEFPALALLISGGHTELVLMKEFGSYNIVGKTLDDAIGECFDKIARTLELPYPGGPEISRLAEEARKKNISSPTTLPRPMIHSHNFDFSFSGLKTAVLYLTQKIGTLTPETRMGIAREAEDAITDVVILKTFGAIEEYGTQTIIIGGGVIANINIREMLKKKAIEKHVNIMFPNISHSTDNAFMIALAGYENRAKKLTGNAPIKALGNLKLG